MSFVPNIAAETEKKNTPAKKKFSPRTLVALTPDCDQESLINTAKILSQSEQVMYVGIVPAEEGQNLTEHASKAGELRKVMQEHSDRVNIRAKARVRVSFSPRHELEQIIAKQKIKLLVLDWKTQHQNPIASEFFENLPCDVAFVRGTIAAQPKEIRVALRGGPHAERAMGIGLKLAQGCSSNLTTFHLEGSDQSGEQFQGLKKILPELKRVTHKDIKSSDFLSSILSESEQSDILVMGTSKDPNKIGFGEITDAVMQKAPSGVIAIKSKRGSSETQSADDTGTHAISVLVDQWFAENSFHTHEFSDLQKLEQLKLERGERISIALPTLNEEATIANIIKIIQTNFMEKHKLVDELIVIDSQSTDRTQEIVKELGVPLFVHQEVLPAHGARRGKGEALWKSLYLTHGDIVLWLDTDVSNFAPHFVYGLLGPLLYRPEIQLIKGFYRRPLKIGTGLKQGRGGRVTELSARPLFNLFYPELSGIIQPLSGEYGGRRSLLEKLSFTSGYGVETSILIDTLEKEGLAAIGQVDILERIHNNQPLQSLSKMSFAIIQTVIGKLEKRYGKQMLEDINRTMKMIRTDDHGHYHLELQEVAELERPPIIELAEYREMWSDQGKKVVN